MQPYTQGFPQKLKPLTSVELQTCKFARWPMLVTEALN